MNDNLVDISVITNGNISIQKAIDYCADRKLIVEVINSEEQAIGEFVCIVDPEDYYEEYYLHYQWMAMLYIKKANKSDKFSFRNATVMALNGNDQVEFYTGNASGDENNTFYRRIGLYDDKVFIEEQLFAKCTKKLLKEHQVPTPGDASLIKYHNYFTKK